MGLSAAAEKWLNGRGISTDNALRMGLYSGKRVRVGEDVTEVLADDHGELIVFPYRRDETILFEKYRGANKTFTAKPGGRPIFWNADVIRDPDVQSGKVALVIVEGEMDLLAVMEAGYPWVISVPNGAPPARDGNGNLIVVPESADDIDPTDDTTFAYVAEAWEDLKTVPRIILAVDNDEPGRRLAAELARRIGRVRCFSIDWPEGCKDMNDVLLQHGANVILELIATARRYPVRGIYKLSELPPVEDLRVYSTGWRRLDDFCQLYPGAFMVTTGRPGEGKTTWTLQLAVQVARLHGWPVMLASFENPLQPSVIRALQGHVIGRPRREWTDRDVAHANDFIERYFTFLAVEPHDDETEATVDWIIDRAADAVIRDGIKMLILDPWNEIEHKRLRDETQTEYTGRVIRHLKRFAKNYDCLVDVIAHPTKSAARDDRPVSLYDISDSAHWANKPDIGIVIDRTAGSNVTTVFVRKIRLREAGKPGEMTIVYDDETQSFSE